MTGLANNSYIKGFEISEIKNHYNKKESVIMIYDTNSFCCRIEPFKGGALRLY